MQSKWKDLSAKQKIISIVSISTSAVVVIFSMLQIFGIWKNAIYVFLPLLAVVNSCQAYLQWKTSRKTAYICIGTAVFILICTLVIIFVK